MRNESAGIEQNKRKKPRGALAVCLLFVLWIGGLMGLFAALPKQEISPAERRVLAKLPQVSVTGILDGSFERNLETYLSDHFPMRRTLTSLEAHVQLYTGRNGQRGVYAGKDGYLIGIPIQSEPEKYSANLKAIDSFAREIGIPCMLMPVPSKGFVMADKLPANHAEYPDGDMLVRAQRELTYTEIVQVEEDLRRGAEEENRQIFYKTDHHWTSDGAYLAYRALADAIGIEPVEAVEYRIEEHPGFYGTDYAKSALWETMPDVLRLYRSDTADAALSVEIVDGGNSPTRTHQGPFFEEQLTGSDPYSVFLDGNHSFVRLTNSEAKGGKLLIVKDSFSHCLVPFLTAHFQQIDMVDLRHYTRSVSQLVTEEGYERILFLYSLSSLGEYTDIARLW